MGWVVLNEYCADLVEGPDGVFAKFDAEKSRLVEQRLELFPGPVEARPFTARTNLVHITTDCDVWIEIEPNPGGADMDMDADAARWACVAPGSQLTATEVFMTCESSESGEVYE
jgi:hypothetical protein